MEERRIFYEKLQDFHREGVLCADAAAGYTIYRARCVYSNAIVALKVYSLQKLSKDMKEQVVREADITLQQDCPFIIKCFDAFEDGDNWVLVMEYCAVGDLGAIMDSSSERDDGWVASQVVYVLLQTIQFLHAKKYVHRTIDPHHILFNSSGVAKLAGFHNVVGMNEQAPHSAVGLLPYMAPEMVQAERSSVNTPYDCKVDVWSLGVVTFELLAGHLPFEDDDNETLAEKILAFEPNYPSHWSPTCTGFLKLALQKDPFDRATASDMLQHPWICNRINWAPDEDFQNPVTVEEGRTISETTEEPKPDPTFTKRWRNAVKKFLGKVPRTEIDAAQGAAKFEAGNEPKAKPLKSRFHGESSLSEVETTQEECEDTYKIGAQLHPTSVLTMPPPDHLHEVIRLSDKDRSSQGDDLNFLPSNPPAQMNAKGDACIDFPSSSASFETPRMTKKTPCGSNSKVHPFAFDPSNEDTLVDIVPQAPTPTPTQKRPSKTRTPDPTPASPPPAQSAVEMQRRTPPPARKPKANPVTISESTIASLLQEIDQ